MMRTSRCEAMPSSPVSASALAVIVCTAAAARKVSSRRVNSGVNSLVSTGAMFSMTLFLASTSHAATTTAPAAPHGRIQSSATPSIVTPIALKTPSVSATSTPPPIAMRARYTTHSPVNRMKSMRAEVLRHPEPTYAMPTAIHRATVRCNTVSRSVSAPGAKGNALTITAAVANGTATAIQVRHPREPRTSRYAASAPRMRIGALRIVTSSGAPHSAGSLMTTAATIANATASRPPRLGRVDSAEPSTSCFQSRSECSRANSRESWSTRPSLRTAIRNASSGVSPRLRRSSIRSRR